MNGSTPLKRRGWEAFCAYATGYSGDEPMTSTDAYMLAYPKSKQRAAARANAARLAARPEVAARCAWMREQLNEAGKMDAANIRSKIVGMRMDIIDGAKYVRNKSFALTAARDLDRMMGFGKEVPGGAIAEAQKELAEGGRVIESITLNVRKLIEGEE